ncbi:MAG: S23 ribosomal protein [uncultured bacterium]|nr:MAG: S23 ribosomal protein [uncultured bacterium]KKR15488.1 MAG: S23 ribosomal protein [Candidatus Levybacteria bacterium GW2011_GWA1_39_32]KKR49751.1 MAG: S23 ribosomal protein [Candidatus Levybacteria bacterium GW2011_GWC1_40_19]KKR95142.1 MAG: S23 ribosomal protein [Candidatus Levybacteria bacterium GW2011_GWA2_41_15]KKS00821.1 MAG: S23 ribosomal protein [Candidatus Levybacteria bacterium GW2011_GWB1_41_21]OGH20606.1 MAG: hypothetical protein A2695_00455 [Candidatus Levybacteria bacteriu
MNKITNFKDLYAWQEGHKLVLLIYKLTEKFPQKEMFGLTNQMRRAAVSITSNIAEGFSRRSYKDKSQFYSMALGSLTELQNQLLVAKDVDYLSDSSFEKTSEQTITVSKLINGLIKKSKTYS